MIRSGIRIAFPTLLFCRAFRDVDTTLMQGMDEYSNILYVKESPAAMSHLAHRVCMDDKYRPESCCIVGNFYSLSSMHEKVSTTSTLASGRSIEI